jgi:predicted transcriptional regulator
MQKLWALRVLKDCDTRFNQMQEDRGMAEAEKKRAMMGQALQQKSYKFTEKEQQSIIESGMTSKKRGRGLHGENGPGADRQEGSH